MKSVVFVLATLAGATACKLGKQNSENKNLARLLRSAEEVAQLVIDALRKEDVGKLRGLFKGLNSANAIKAFRNSIEHEFYRIDKSFDELIALRKTVKTDSMLDKLVKHNMDDLHGELREFISYYGKHTDLAYRVGAGDTSMRAKILAKLDEAKLQKWEDFAQIAEADGYRGMRLSLNTMREVMVSSDKVFGEAGTMIRSHLRNSDFGKLKKLYTDKENNRYYTLYFRVLMSGDELGVVDFYNSLARKNMLDAEKLVSRLEEASLQDIKKIWNELVAKMDDVAFDLNLRSRIADGRGLRSRAVENSVLTADASLGKELKYSSLQTSNNYLNTYPAARNEIYYHVIGKDDRFVLESDWCEGVGRAISKAIGNKFPFPYGKSPELLLDTVDFYAGSRVSFARGSIVSTYVLK